MTIRGSDCGDLSLYCSNIHLLTLNITDFFRKATIYLLSQTIILLAKRSKGGFGVLGDRKSVV